MQIIEFKAENVKRLKAVTIRPDGSLIVIGGENAQGKSSVLDAIMAALGGERLIDEKPLRNDTDKGFVELDLGDLKVRRTFTKAGGGTITVRASDGTKMESPQKVLDALLGQISFDPLAFARMPKKEQMVTLKDLVGLNFDELDAKRKKAYDNRTEVARQARTHEANIEGKTVMEGSNLEEVSLEGLANQLSEAMLANKKVQQYADDLDRVEKELIEVAERLAQVDERRKVLDAKKIELQALCATTNAVDESPLHREMRRIEVVNAEARCNQDILRRQEAIKELHSKVDYLGGEIADIDGKKAEMVAAAIFPIGGLGFDEDGVTYQSLPFSQASDAERLRVSVALGLAMNKELKVLLVRDGSLLDRDNLALVAGMADEAGAQVWMERVGKGDEVSVIMEDGETGENSSE